MRGEGWHPCPMVVWGWQGHGPSNALCGEWAGGGQRPSWLARAALCPVPMDPQRCPRAPGGAPLREQVPPGMQACVVHPFYS